MFVLLLSLAGAAQSANLDVAPAPPAAPPSHLVRELLEQDAQRALREAQRSDSGTSVLGAVSSPAAPGAGASSIRDAASATTSKAAAPPVVQLQAIVGVDRNLSAIVVRAGRRSVFRAGNAAPVAGTDEGFRLIRIATPCVVLEQPASPPTSQASTDDSDAQSEAAARQASLLTVCLHRSPP